MGSAVKNLMGPIPSKKGYYRRRPYLAPYEEEVLRTNPLCWWQMNDGVSATSIADTMGNLDLPEVGSPTYQYSLDMPTGMDPNQNGVVYLDGSSCFEEVYANIPTAVHNAMISDHTFLVWMRHVSGTFSGDDYIASIMGDNESAAENAAMALCVTINNDWKILAEYGSGTNETYSYTGGDYYHSSGLWRLVGWHLDYTNKYIYVYNNGTLYRKGFVNAPASSSTLDFVIGALGNGATPSSYMNAEFTNAMFWDRTLEEEEIGRIFAAGSVFDSNVSGQHPEQHQGLAYRIMEKNPISYWKMSKSGGFSRDECMNNDQSATGGNVTGVQEGLVVDRYREDRHGPQYHLTFDGSGDYKRQGPISSRNLRNIRRTQGAWFRMDNMSHSPTLFSVSATGETEATNYRNSMRVIVSGGVGHYQHFYEQGSGTNYTYDSANVDLIAGEVAMHAHVCMATTNRMFFYHNGRLVTTSSYTTDPSGGTAGYAQFGTRYDGNGSPLAGDMSHAFFIQSCLSARQVMRMFTEGSCYHDTQAAIHYNLPAAYWNLRESTGSRRDWVQNVYPAANLTVASVPTQGTTDGPVDDVYYYSFDGVDDYFYAADTAALSITGEMWIGAWIRKSSAPTTKNEGIISKRAASQHAYALEMTTSGYIELYISPAADGTGAVTLTDDTALTDGEWHYVLAYYNPSTVMEIWVDGILHARSTSSIPAAMVDTTAQTLIGCTVDTADSDYMWGGDIAEPAIWSNAKATTDTVDVNDYATEPWEPADWRTYYWQTPLEMWNIWYSKYAPEYSLLYEQRQQEPVFVLPMQDWDGTDTYALVYCEPGSVTDGSASYSAANVAGFNGPVGMIAGNFQGSEYLEADAYATDLDAHAQGTIELVFKTQNGDGVLFELLGATPTSDAVQVKVEASTGYLQFYVESGDTVQLDCEVQTDFADGKWHHVAVNVTTASGNTIYVDGAAQTVAYTTGSSSSTNFLDDITGADIRVGTGFTGFITAVAVYDTPLAADEIFARWSAIRTEV